MTTPILVRLGALAAALTMTAVGLAPAAHAEEASGVITGRLTEATGEPLVDATVSVETPAGVAVASTTTLSGGGYKTPRVPVGEYRVKFEARGYRAWWAYQAERAEEAAVVTVVAEKGTEVNDVAPPALSHYGSLSGIVRAAPGGEGLAGVDVYVRPKSADIPAPAKVRTTSSGRYIVLDLLPGQYSIEYAIPNSLRWWAHHSYAREAAQTFTVVAGVHTQIAEETVPPHGTISGRIVDADGKPAAVTIRAEATRRGAPTGFSAKSSPTDGTYTIPRVPPGDYRVQFSAGDRWWWAHHAISEDRAQVFRIAAGETVTVDESIPRNGSISVTATDEATGAPLQRFCVDRGPYGGPACTDDGSVVLSDLFPRVHLLSVTAEEDLYFHEGHQVEVRPGQTTAVAATLVRGAGLTVVARDAAAHTPVAQACVHLVEPGSRGTEPSHSSACTDAEGNLKAGPFAPGTYQIYVQARDGVHGSQWIGRHGGTGDQRVARKVQLRVGERLALPPIEFATAGQITGTVTDAKTGQPVAGICAYPHASRGVPTSGRHENCTDDSGHYRISGLGPYAWPVEFTDHSGAYAWQWSGGAPHRLVAKPVRVIAGEDAAADARLVPAAKVSGTVRDVSGGPAGWGSVDAFNAISGDYAGPPSGTEADGRYVISGLAGQLVKIQYRSTDKREAWYRNARDFWSARPVYVRAGDTVAGIDITLPTS